MEENESVFGDELGLGSHEGSLGSRVSEPLPSSPAVCRPSPHLGPPSPEGFWPLLLQVRRGKLEGNPEGERSEGGEAAAARGSSVCTQGAAPRRGWAPSGLCSSSVPAPPSKHPAFSALSSRAPGGATSGGARSALSPWRAHAPARSPARPRDPPVPPTPPPRLRRQPPAARAPLPGRAEGPVGRGRRSRAEGPGWGSAEIRAGCSPVSRWCQFWGLGIFPPFMVFRGFFFPSSGAFD